MSSEGRSEARAALPSVIASITHASDSGSLTLEHVGAEALAEQLAGSLDRAVDAADWQAVADLSRELRAVLEGLGLVLRVATGGDPLDRLIAELSGTEDGDTP